MAPCHVPAPWLPLRLNPASFHVRLLPAVYWRRGGCAKLVMSNAATCSVAATIAVRVRRRLFKQLFWGFFPMVMLNHPHLAETAPVRLCHLPG